MNFMFEENETKTINAKYNDTILFFKFLIYLKGGFNYESYWHDLIFAQKAIKKFDRTLIDYYILKNTTMYLRWNRMGVC